ncbi:AraC family transcriptional regulator [Paenibacillus zeisoli]|uniref:AraC family transcriptional regulator n=1 Tax=Paenibacillus zeisoli TaxID=2496267 RepID=A0A433XNN0_9BACL|nr:AraC family transcriptional regulator [Paenibacillus zeisoli]RUT35692.1 AraC family transcriptional regulator [Paenibacillus zeisoli]
MQNLCHSLYESKLLEEAYIPQIAAYYYKQWDGFEMKFHRHNRVEVMYVISGTCRVDTEAQSFRLKKGDFILLDADVLHKLHVDQGCPCRMLNVEFHFAKAGSDVPSMKVMAEGNRAVAQLLALKVPYVLLRENGDVYATLKNLIHEMDAKAADNQLMINLLLSQLIIRIATLAVEAAPGDAHESNKYVSKMITYIHQNYDRDIRVLDIASAVNLHPGYVHRIFKACTGRTVTEFLTIYRIEKAQMLLSHTDIPVVEISDYIGINSSQYFSTLFKKITGKTPMEYRKPK